MSWVIVLRQSPRHAPWAFCVPEARDSLNRWMVQLKYAVRYKTRKLAVRKKNAMNRLVIGSLRVMSRAEVDRTWIEWEMMKRSQ